MNLLRQKEWKDYRAEQIKLHGGVCAHCLRSGEDEGVVLQVHHKEYVSGRKPWEYPYAECEVLCKGCHAKEHGEIKPSKDWELLGVDELEELEGDCDHCGKTELRYVHMVYHPQWGVMLVGAQCCDKLTESTVGTESHADFLNYINRRKTFAESPKWLANGSGGWRIKRANIAIELVSTKDCKFQICLDGVHGKAEHPTLLDAKISVFDFVESGEAAAYLQKRKERDAKSSAKKEE